ncbi:MAG: F0F1 ATP synthase subunit delta [bacterium]|nr:F0F1 ATP synthase subunit delta [bacterium]
MSRASTREIATAIRDLSKSNKAGLADAVAAYLVQERRTSELEKIMREVANLNETKDGIVEVDVSSAFPINDKVKSDIKQLIKEDKVIFNESIDKSLIGGVRVETREKFLDLTLRSRLNKFKARSN